MFKFVSVNFFIFASYRPSGNFRRIVQVNQNMHGMPDRGNTFAEM